MTQPSPNNPPQRDANKPIMSSENKINPGGSGVEGQDRPPDDRGAPPSSLPSSRPTFASGDEDNEGDDHPPPTETILLATFETEANKKK
jgi:hypothetical protein